MKLYRRGTEPHKPLRHKPTLVNPCPSQKHYDVKLLYRRLKCCLFHKRRHLQAEATFFFVQSSNFRGEEIVPAFVCTITQSLLFYDQNLVVRISLASASGITMFLQSPIAPPLTSLNDEYCAKSQNVFFFVTSVGALTLSVPTQTSGCML